MNYKQLSCTAFTHFGKQLSYDDMYHMKFDTVAHSVSPFKTGVLFENFPDTEDTVFYLCEYISKKFTWRNFLDTRTENLARGFKFMEGPEPFQFVLDSLKESLCGKCVLVAVPPSKVERNFDTPVHDLIYHLANNVTTEKLVRDGRYCLRRDSNIDAAHEKWYADRSEEKHLQSISLQHTDYLANQHVIIMDDITTTGNSFKACAKIIRDQVPNVKSISYFAIARTIEVDDVKLGFILDLDTYLLQLYRRLYTEDFNFTSLVEQLKMKIAFVTHLPQYTPDIDYRFVTSMNYSDAVKLAKFLEINESRIISFKDTFYHKPHAHPYLLAKQQMQIYEPFITVLTDSQELVTLAEKIGMHGQFVDLSTMIPFPNAILQTLSEMTDIFADCHISLDYFCKPIMKCFEDVRSLYYGTKI